MAGADSLPKMEGDQQARVNRRIIRVLVFLAVLVAVISSLGAPLIPSIARQDHVSLATAQWVLTAALLTGAVATPVLGRLADGSHQRRVLTFTLCTVIVGCVLAAATHSFWLLVLGRALQGVGLGLLPVNMAIAKRLLPSTVATKAVVTISAAAAIGAGLGYSLTTAITQLFGLPAAYWGGAIVVGLTLGAVTIVIPARSAGIASPIDLLGAALLSIAVASAMVVLSEGVPWGFSSGATLSFGLLGGISLAAWILHELRSKSPLVDLRHLRRRMVLMADVSGLLLSMALYMATPIITVFVQIPSSAGFGFGASVFTAGLALLPLSLGTFVASRTIGLWERSFGIRSLVPAGAMLGAGASLYFAFNHSALWQAFVTMGIAGLGLGWTFAALPGFILHAVPAKDTGSATGLYQLLRNVGLATGSAVSAAILHAHSTPGNPVPLESGFVFTLICSALLCTTAAVLSFVLPPKGSSLLLRSPLSKEAETGLAEQALLEASGAMLVDESDLEGPSSSRR